MIGFEQHAADAAKEMTPIRVVLGEESYLARQGITRVLDEIPSV